MSELLEVNHVSYAYHSIDGETETLADMTFKAGKRRNPARWQKHRRRKRADRLYAAERLSG